MPKWREQVTSTGDGTGNDNGTGTGTGNTIGQGDEITQIINVTINHVTEDVTVDTSLGGVGLYVVDTLGGDVTLSLPALADGNQYYVKKVDATAGKVIVSGNVAEEIDGMGEVWLTSQYDGIHIIANATSWHIV